MLMSSEKNTTKDIALYLYAMNWSVHAVFNMKLHSFCKTVGRLILKFQVHSKYTYLKVHLKST